MTKSNVDKLILCALMGDQEAQKELTEQYKLLPCLRSRPDGRGRTDGDGENGGAER